MYRCDVTFVLIRYCILQLRDSFAVGTTNSRLHNSQSVRRYSDDNLLCNGRGIEILVRRGSTECHLDFTRSTFPQPNSPPFHTGVWWWCNEIAVCQKRVQSLTMVEHTSIMMITHIVQTCWWWMWIWHDRKHSFWKADKSQFKIYQLHKGCPSRWYKKLSANARVRFAFQWWVKIVSRWDKWINYLWLRKPYLLSTFVHRELRVIAQLRFV